MSKRVSRSFPILCYRDRFNSKCVMCNYDRCVSLFYIIISLQPDRPYGQQIRQPLFCNTSFEENSNKNDSAKYNTWFFERTYNAHNAVPRQPFPTREPASIGLWPRAGSRILLRGPTREIARATPSALYDWRRFERKQNNKLTEKER